MHLTERVGLVVLIVLTPLALLAVWVSDVSVTLRASVTVGLIALLVFAVRNRDTFDFLQRRPPSRSDWGLLVIGAIALTMALGIPLALLMLG